jgi:hypothetical protein
MTHVAATSAVRHSSPAAAGTTPGAAPASLLPEPDLGALAGADPLSVLFLFESKDSQHDEKTAASKLQGLEAQRHDALKKEQDAIQKAVDASKSHGFWDDLGHICGDIAKIAGIVAAVAAAIGTAGALAPVAWAGVALSSAGFLDGETHVLEKLGISADVAGWVDLGLSLGGSLGAASVAIFGSSAAATSATSAVKTAALVVDGAGTIGKGAAAIESAHEQAETDRAGADETAAKASSDHIGRLLQTLMAQLKDSDEKSQHIISTITQIKATQNDTALAAAAGIRG